MELGHYQQRALVTDQRLGTEEAAIVIPLLGIAGEIGTLLTEYKKFLRDGSAHQLFTDQVAEELGDVLWYVANLATKFQLSLDQIAGANLHKVSRRWLSLEDGDPGTRLFDETYPAQEQLPRFFEVQFSPGQVDGRDVVYVTRGGSPVGDPLTDNAYIDDGYRFHDVFHFAYATFLGWSPVTRRNLKCKRKSNALIDEVEDGGRAIVTEEAIAAFMYDYARRHEFFATTSTVDFDRLKTILSLVSSFEVGVRTARQWEHAIVEGYRIWRLLRQHHGGLVACDLVQQRLHYQPCQRRHIRGRAVKPASLPERM
jgi:NTP pyrophosphatase (non-canonical NTP hydrolase)